MDKDLDPKNLTVRESRDSDLNPLSTPIMVGLDVTGSMSMVLDAMVRGLGTLVKEIYDRKPVSDPHILCGGIGDVEMGDVAPLQVTQFEADIRIADQLTKIWLEQGGGGNSYESYALFWYFAGMFTEIDSFEKRGKKGYLFTVGDEEPTPYLFTDHIQKVFGGEKLRGNKLDMDDLLAMATKKYEVFHIMVAQGNHFRSAPDHTKRRWTELLGQRAILLSDHTKLSEVIVSAIQVNEGANAADVIGSWDGSTSVTVAEAVRGLTTASGSPSSGVVRF
jgi:hypothetical protein